MHDYDYDMMQYMQYMNIPNQMQPMVNMPEENLERMYPEIYYKIQPEVERQCDMLDMTYGYMYAPSRQDVDRMVDDIYSRVEQYDMETSARQVSADADSVETQFFGGRGALRDLVGILLIRELLDRRRRPFFPYGGFGRRMPRRFYY